jgi:hypothetical protein
MKKPTLLLLVVVLVGAGCGQAPVSRPAPSVAQIGEDLKCAAGDHGFEDSEAGWGFCYPATWKYVEKAQGYSVPIHRLDLTFDVTDAPCVLPSPVGGQTPRPICSPGAGLFGFMIISTYERGAAPDLVTWMQTNLGQVVDRQAIVWGNAAEADRLSDGRRIALTPNHVVIMELRSGLDQLNLESEMSSRLDTWKFLF